MTKILIDPVYTGKAHKCSTSYLAWEIIEGLIEQRDDVFFYLMYPTKAEDDPVQMDFLRRHSDRVRLYPYPYLQSDRLEEMFKMHEAFIDLLAPGDTPVWDIDVVLTSRIPQIPYIRNFLGRETNFPKGSHRLVVGLEEMPIFKFRDSVAWAAGGNMDLPSLAAYHEAGAIIINNLWTKNEVLKTARNYLSPSNVMELGKTIHEAVPVRLSRFKKLSRTSTDPFNVVFTGRMTGTRAFADVAKVFRDHYSFPLGKGGREIKFIVSTNSMSTGSADVGDISFMGVQYNDRAKFHALMKDVAHVVVNLSPVEDFSLSTYEPLMFGVPVILPKEPWTNFLGADYPFRVANNTEAYAVVKQFAKDYEGQMQKFRSWEASTWKTIVGKQTPTTLEVLRKLVDQHEVYLHQRLEEMDGGAIYRDLRDQIIATGEPLVDALKFGRDKGFFYTNSKVFKGIPIGKRANAYLLKVYMNMAGWKDTNEPGVLARP